MPGGAGQDDLLDAIRNRDYAAADALIRQHPARLDAGKALAIAIRLGDPDAVRVYAPRYGLDQTLDGQGSTPLMLAAMSAPRQSAEKVAVTLLELGADPTRRDGAGKLASYHARWRGEFGLAGLLDRQAAQFLLARRQAERSPRHTPWLPSAASAGSVTTASSAAAASRAGARPERSAAVRASAPPPRGGPGRPVTVAGTHRSASVAASAAAMPAVTLPQLVRSIWVPSIDRDTPAQPYAAFRFHADGTGELLSWSPTTGQASTIDASFLAWELRNSALSFAVLTEDLAAWCMTSAAQPGQLQLACRAYHLADSDFADPLKMVSLDFARVMLDSPGARARMVPAEDLRAELRPASQPVCRPRPYAGPPPAPASASRMSDWHVYDPANSALYSPGSGAACSAQESARAALAQCRGPGRQCVGVGGCPAGQVSAVATTQGWRGAVVGCDVTAEAARAKALQACRSRAGCDCTLVGSFGNNVNTVRLPVCSAIRPAGALVRVGTGPAAHPGHSVGRNPSTER